MEILSDSLWNMDLPKWPQQKKDLFMIENEEKKKVYKPGSVNIKKVSERFSFKIKHKKSR